jgi:hypothetical protein
LLSHPDLDGPAAGQVPAVSWIEEENAVCARLGDASPSVEATLVDPDDLAAGRRPRLGDPKKSRRDYRPATDHPPVKPNELSRLRNSWSQPCECDPRRALCGRRRRSGRGRAQEEKDSSDRDGDAAPHEATLTPRALRPTWTRPKERLSSGRQPRCSSLQQGLLGCSVAQCSVAQQPPPRDAAPGPEGAASHHEPSSRLIRPTTTSDPRHQGSMIVRPWATASDLVRQPVHGGMSAAETRRRFAGSSLPTGICVRMGRLLSERHPVDALPGLE